MQILIVAASKPPSHLHSQLETIHCAGVQTDWFFQKMWEKNRIDFKYNTSFTSPTAVTLCGFWTDIFAGSLWLNMEWHFLTVNCLYFSSINSNQQAWTHQQQQFCFLHPGLTRTGPALGRKYKTNVWEYDVWLVPCIAYHQRWLITVSGRENHTHVNTLPAWVYTHIQCKEKCTKPEGTHTKANEAETKTTG